MFERLRFLFLRVEKNAPREKVLLIWMSVIAILITLLDQATKEVVVRTLSPGEIIPVCDGFNWVFVRNYGAAFGQFQGRGIVLLGISAVVLAGIFLFFRKWTEECPERFVAIGLLIAGIFGNGLDRLFRTPAAVIDFVDLYVKDYHWPAFNVADIAICCAVGIIILSTIFRQDYEKYKSRNAEALPRD